MEVSKRSRTSVRIAALITGSLLLLLGAWLVSIGYTFGIELAEEGLTYFESIQITFFLAILSGILISIDKCVSRVISGRSEQ